MDGFLIPLIHHWGGGIRPARRRAGGLKGASISAFNGEDGAITSVEGQCSCLVCCCVYMSLKLSTLWVFHLRFSFFWPYGSCTPTTVRSNTFHALVKNCIFISASCATYPQCHFKMCISSSMVFISNLLFQFTHFGNVPWLMGEGGCSVYLYIREWNIHIARFSEQKLSRFSLNGTWD